MTSANRETTTLRRRHDELDAAADARRGTTVECAPAMVVQTYAKSSYPTAAKSYYACHPVKVAGTEAEGQAVTTTVDTGQTLLVANVGSTVPPSGTTLVATLVGSRWEMNI
jgi:hypothetical protein